jgi:NAD(P)-dependent dehydrogenase (short-subunit alcohol dehydrogenase family)
MSDRFLEGRVAVVTGAGRGIGRAIALALGGAGARLALMDRTQADALETEKLARDAGVQCASFGCDVREEPQVQALAAQVMQRFGAVHILVNNAGTAIRKRLQEFTLEEWRLVIDTNLTGPWLMCRHFIPHMQGRGYGRIINLTSIMAHVSSDGRGAYSASKSGLLGLTRALAAELAEDGITAVAISPGFVETDLTAVLRSDPQKSAALLAQTPLRRYGKPEEIAALALYICSDAAGYMTGNDVLIDGGWCAQ